MPTLAEMQAASGSTPADPNWNPACDLNSDGAVDNADWYIFYGQADPSLNSQIDEWTGNCQAFVVATGAPWDFNSNGVAGLADPYDWNWFLSHGYGTDLAKIVDAGNAYGKPATAQNNANWRVYDANQNGVVDWSDIQQFHQTAFGITPAQVGPAPIPIQWPGIPHDNGLTQYTGDPALLADIHPGLATPPAGSGVYIIEGGHAWVIEPPSGQWVVRIAPGEVPPESIISKDFWVNRMKPGALKIATTPPNPAATPAPPTRPVPGSTPRPVPTPSGPSAPVPGRSLIAQLGRLLSWALIGGLINQALNEIADAVDRCLEFTARMTAQWFDVKIGLQALLDVYETSRRDEIAAIGGSPKCDAWRRSATARHEAAIAEIRRRLDHATAKWQFWVNADCITGTGVHPDQALADLAGAVDLYNDATANYMAWGEAIDAIAAECGG